MARTLDVAHEAALERCSRMTTLSITLGNGTVLRLATGECTVNSVAYQAKLAPLDALNLELTNAFEGINLQIEDVSFALRQTLINTVNILDGTEAVLGCFFKDFTTGNTWHDEKIVGEVELGQIEGNFINVFFKAKTDAAIYGGINIADVFKESDVPDAEIPVISEPPIYNDISIGINDGISDDYNDWRKERYYVPLMTYLEN